MRIFQSQLFVLSLACIQVLLIVNFLMPSRSWSAQGGEEFNVEGGAVKKDNLFNLFFGGAPLMPTQHGTVIVEAYHDRNDNQIKDPGEETLDRAVVCIVDEVTYSVPAFIPGLENGLNYTFLFEGEEFEPSIKKKDVFIKKRGQIIRIDLPCRPRESLSALVPSES